MADHGRPFLATAAEADGNAGGVGAEATTKTAPSVGLPVASNAEPETCGSSAASGEEGEPGGITNVAKMMAFPVMLAAATATLCSPGTSEITKILNDQEKEEACKSGDAVTTATSARDATPNTTQDAPAAADKQRDGQVLPGSAKSGVGHDVPSGDCDGATMLAELSQQKPTAVTEASQREETSNSERGQATGDGSNDIAAAALSMATVGTARPASTRHSQLPVPLAKPGGSGADATTGVADAKAQSDPQTTPIPRATGGALNPTQQERHQLQQQQRLQLKQQQQQQQRQLLQLQSLQRGDAQGAADLQSMQRIAQQTLLRQQQQASHQQQQAAAEAAAGRKRKTEAYPEASGASDGSPGPSSIPAQVQASKSGQGGPVMTTLMPVHPGHMVQQGLMGPGGYGGYRMVHPSMSPFMVARPDGTVMMQDPASPGHSMMASPWGYFASMQGMASTQSGAASGAMGAHMAQAAGVGALQQRQHQQQQHQHRMMTAAAQQQGSPGLNLLASVTAGQRNTKVGKAGGGDGAMKPKKKRRSDKTYSCEFCERVFSCSSNLKRHKSMHTGLKPYSCCYCGKDFSNSSNRRKHERTHVADGSAKAKPPAAG